MRKVFFIGCFAALLLGCTQSGLDTNTLTMATTTSTRDSGLMDVLLPMFEAQTGMQVKVVAVGSGQALEMGRRGDVDLLLTHAPDAEATFVEQGFGINRQVVMHNDFVIVGPPHDPAAIKGASSVIQALRKVCQRAATFVSRGDNSGTHMKEEKLWAQAESQPAGDWYLEAGAGMAATLRVASEKQAYSLCDRGTFLAHRDNLQLEILCEGHALFRNDYSVTLVSATKHPHVNSEGAEAFAAFLLADTTQHVIAEFGKQKYGQPLFFADAL